MKSFMSVIKENRANFRKRLVNERAAIEMQIRDEGKKYCPNIANTVQNCDVTSAKVGNIASQKKKNLAITAHYCFARSQVCYSMIALQLNSCVDIESIKFSV